MQTFIVKMRNEDKDEIEIIENKMNSKILFRIENYKGNKKKLK